MESIKGICYSESVKAITRAMKKIKLAADIGKKDRDKLMDMHFDLNEIRQTLRGKRDYERKKTLSN